MTQESFFPTGLSRKAFSLLEGFYGKANEVKALSYLERCKTHLEEARASVKRKPTINIALAEAIVSALQGASERWETIPPYSKRWLCAAMLYFVEFQDEEHDFDTLVGFDDDAEILNACLVLAKLEHLIIKIEDFA